VAGPETPQTSHPDTWRWRDGPVAPGPTVVFDIDGVLADATRRQHLIERPHRDWDAFFEACGDDALIVEVARLLEVIAADHRVVLLTGRPIWVQRHTVDWLTRHGLRWDLLVMRHWGDYAAARRFKQEVVGQLRRRGFDLRLAFEDDPRNVEMFHDEGVPCIYIHSGYHS
jgi:phosphoglycolate phosphatase-like HAD superfamily hydrolase